MCFERHLLRSALHPERATIQRTPGSSSRDNCAAVLRQRTYPVPRTRRVSISLVLLQDTVRIDHLFTGILERNTSNPDQSVPAPQHQQ